MEKWVVINGFADYAVSSLGVVKRVVPGRPGGRSEHNKIMKFAAHPGGYLNVTLTNKKKSRKFYVHRIVATAFLGAAPGNKIEINHKNGNKKDNRADNLEWVTHRENIIHARGTLKKQMGSKNKPFVCVETGKVYQCYYEASQDLKIPIPTIKSYFSLKLKNPRHGLSFKRVKPSHP